MNEDYEYEPRLSHPKELPISEHELEMSLSACESHCMHSWYHDCYIIGNSTSAIERIPKRKSALEVESGALEFAWGLHAHFAISLVRLLLYHSFLFAGAIAFWAWWQTKHLNDLQNASIPVLTMAAFITLFWGSAAVLKIPDEQRVYS